MQNSVMCDALSRITSLGRRPIFSAFEERKTPLLRDFCDGFGNLLTQQHHGGLRIALPAVRRVGV